MDKRNSDSGVAEVVGACRSVHAFKSSHTIESACKSTKQSRDVQSHYEPNYGWFCCCKATLESPESPIRVMPAARSGGLEPQDTYPS